MKLIVFATLLEARETLERFDAKEITKTFYSYSEGHIVISGIGSYAAMGAVFQHAKFSDEIYNVGFCASLKEHPIGSFFSCNMVGKYLPLPEKIDLTSKKFMQEALPFFTYEEAGLSLLSSDFPIHSQKIKEGLKSDWDLVDMEGYGIAFAGAYLKKKTRFLKIVSDFASENGRALIQENSQKLSTALSHLLKGDTSRISHTL